MGFTISDHHVTLALRAGLEPDTWDSHLDLLRTSYPDWIFDSGYLFRLVALPDPPRRQPGRTVALTQQTRG